MFIVDKIRFFHVDFLRAVGIIAVIAIHTYSYSITSPRDFFIWNYLHFIIVAFIFCSGYVLFGKFTQPFSEAKSLGKWYLKRIQRLLYPYYLYLIIHFSLFYFFPTYFSGLGMQKSGSFIFQSLLLTGGINLNWLPLLFIELAILFPFLLSIMKNKAAFTIYVLSAILITVGFTVFSFPYGFYRWVMWIPWSLIFILAKYFVQNEKNGIRLKPYIAIASGSGALWGILYFVFIFSHKSLTLIDNKYPPNLFYILYELSVSFFLVPISILFNKSYLRAAVTFISKYSYGLFFIHFIILDFVLKFVASNKLVIDPSIEFVIVIITSVSLLALYNNFKPNIHF